jgi:hypothetical protein
MVMATHFNTSRDVLTASSAALTRALATFEPSV